MWYCALLVGLRPSLSWDDLRNNIEATKRLYVVRSWPFDIMCNVASRQGLFYCMLPRRNALQWCTVYMGRSNCNVVACDGVTSSDNISCNIAIQLCLVPVANQCWALFAGSQLSRASYSSMQCSVRGFTVVLDTSCLPVTTLALNGKIPVLLKLAVIFPRVSIWLIALAVRQHMSWHFMPSPGFWRKFWRKVWH